MGLTMRTISNQLMTSCSICFTVMGAFFVFMYHYFQNISRSGDQILLNNSLEQDILFEKKFQETGIRKKYIRDICITGSGVAIKITSITLFEF